MTQQGDVTIEFHFDGVATLSVTEVWPDGDAPEVITAEAVAQRVRESVDGLPEFLDQWCLERDVDVTAVVLRSPAVANAPDEQQHEQHDDEDPEKAHASYLPDVAEVSFR